MRVKQKRMIKQIVMLAGLCLIVSMVLHFTMAPGLAYDASQFDLEKELKLLPQDQRDAARAKWNSLSETRQNQAKKISERLSDKQKKALAEKLQNKTSP